MSNLDVYYLSGCAAALAQMARAHESPSVGLAACGLRMHMHFVKRGDMRPLGGAPDLWVRANATEPSQLGGELDGSRSAMAACLPWGPICARAAQLAWCVRLK